MSLNTPRATRLFPLILAFSLCVVGGGCNYFMPAAVDDDIDLAELDDEGRQDDIDDESDIDDLEDAPPKSFEQDGKMKSGDRFPLSKTIEHRLTQTDSEGTRVSTSRTEIELTLIVDRILSDGRKQMSVKYERVQFEQQSGGKRVFYSSDRQADAVPPEAFLYSGLAGNGFTFWIDPTNRVGDVTGYAEFLQRCLRNVPAQFRENVQRQLEASKVEAGVATFVDDSIGMLPYRFDPKHTNVAIPQGTGWDLEPRYCESPIPIVTHAQCVLKELTSNSADIRLTGQISGPDEPVPVRHAEGDFTVSVKGGRCNGTCRIDRRTGLPTLSQIQRDIDLIIEFPDGQRVEQNKVTFSTLTGQSSLLQRAEMMSDSRVESASFQSPSHRERSSRVVQPSKFRQN